MSAEKIACEENQVLNPIQSCRLDKAILRFLMPLKQSGKLPVSSSQSDPHTPVCFAYIQRRPVPIQSVQLPVLNTKCLEFSGCINPPVSWVLERISTGIKMFETSYIEQPVRHLGAEIVNGRIEKRQRETIVGKRPRNAVERTTS